MEILGPELNKYIDKKFDEKFWGKIFDDVRLITRRTTKRKLSRKEILKRMNNRCSRIGDKYVNVVNGKGYHYVYRNENEVDLVDVVENGHSLWYQGGNKC